MTMTIAAATARISRHLPEAELSFDNALLASTRLMESMLLARQAPGVAALSGQSAIMRLAKAQRSLIESQNDLLRVHGELLDLGREVKAITDEPGNCEPSAIKNMGAEHLQAA